MFIFFFSKAKHNHKQIYKYHLTRTGKKNHSSQTEKNIQNSKCT